MLKQLKKSQKGFTIIEVLIVLAIAGLILLIVFLAVPALQRNSRNTQRRAAVANVLGGISEFITNNNGTLPDTFTYDSTAGTLVISKTGASSSTARVPAIFTTVPNPTTVPGTLNPNADTLQIYTAATCNGTVATGGGSARAYVAYFGIEPGNIAQCQGS